MSLVRVRRNHSASALPRKKHLIRKKPAWDDTVNDLETMKASAEDIARRKAAHQSKHALISRLQKQNDITSKRKKTADLSISSAEARQLAIMKEVLYDQRQLQSVISKSDKMLASVKDLFGDDPRRFAGIPNVTSAPNKNTDGSLVAPDLPVNTKMDYLSDSVMDASALNDLQHSLSEGEDEDDGYVAEPITYESKLNMDRFQQFLAMQEKNNSLSTISGQAQISQMANGPGQSTHLKINGTMDETEDSLLHTPPKESNESVSILRTPKSAINDTRKIRKTKKKVPTPKKSEQNTSASSSFNLVDLRKVLEGLQDEICELEKQTGRKPPAERHRQETFSGYTLSLIDSVTKLCRYLKETDLRVNAEVILREQLMQDIAQLTSLIDALTADIIGTQEEYTKLKEDFIRYKLETQSELHVMKNALIDAGILASPSHSGGITPPLSEGTSEDKHEALQQYLQTGDISSIPEHMRSAAAAVLLSPPVRKSRLQNAPPRAGEENSRQSSLVEISGSRASSEMSNPSRYQAPMGPNPREGGPVHAVNGSHVSGHPQSMQTYSVAVGRPGVVSMTTQPQNVTTHQNQTNNASVMGQYSSQARVNVPRPGSLVQGNTDAFGQSIQGLSQQQQPQQVSLPQTTVSSSSSERPIQTNVPGTLAAEPSSREMLTAQIAELNRQHEEAQMRMQNLLQQQRIQQEMQQNQQQMMQRNRMEFQQPSIPQPSATAYPVSPPISPISGSSENFAPLQPKPLPRANSGNPGNTRGITIALPSAQLETSTESSPSPKHK